MYIIRVAPQTIMPKSLSEGPTCCICLEIYDQELARAFTASCGHSICAQCEFKLRIACMKKGIPSQCWICMKPFEGPLYRTYALESATPRTDVPRFSNPYLTNSQIRQQLTINPEIYKDITLPNYTPPEPDLPEPLPRQHQQPPSGMNIQRPMLIRPSTISDSIYPPTYSGYYPANINLNRHHPYRPMTTNNYRINSMMPCYPSSHSQQPQQYPSNPIR
uniref:RING-type domain-containing protein n=1 Tax=Panagrolaimus sp. ES5 TaxID=591445 RepID=A0AC34GHR9_9BILA